MAWLQHLTLHGIVFVTTTGRSQAITSHTGSNILRGVVRRNERVYQAIFCSGLRDVSDGGHVLRGAFGKTSIPLLEGWEE